MTDEKKENVIIICMPLTIMPEPISESSVTKHCRLCGGAVWVSLDVPEHYDGVECILCFQPKECTAVDVTEKSRESLRKRGWSDEEIDDAVARVRQGRAGMMEI